MPSSHVDGGVPAGSAAEPARPRRVPAGGADVSVVVPAYDATRTLDATLASIAGQSAAPGEVVVVDDCSTDATAACAAAWEGRLPLRVERLPGNVGLAGARHAGITRASRPLVALVDADDLWLPDHLASMLALDVDDDRVAIAQLLRWVPGVGVAAAVDERFKSVPPPADQLRVAYRWNWGGAAMLVTRHAYDRAGGFRVGMRRSEDWDLLLRLLRTGTRAVRPPNPTYLYRTEPGTLSFGDANAEADLAVMEHAVSEAVTEEERGWARAARRERAARVALKHAYDAARAGDGRRARTTVLRCGRGDRRVLAQAAFLLAAPARAARWRDERFADLARVL